MSIVNTSTKLLQSHSRSETLIKTNDDNNDSQERIRFLPQLHIKPGHYQQQNMNTPNNNTSLPPSQAERNPSSLLELKQQRLVEAADRRKRLITRIISVVGLLIILLCAIIVALTLKMAPKIDELVRTKSGTHPSVHLMSRMTTPLTATTTTTIESNNSSLLKSILRVHRTRFTQSNSYLL